MRDYGVKNMAIEPITHLEKSIAGEVEPVTHLEKVVAEYGGGGGGGGESTIAWKPSVSSDGTISWTRTSSTTTPTPVNVKGEKGDAGATGEKGDTGEKGADGAKGDKGDDGYSPTITVTEITGGHRVTVTDAVGSESFDVMDGQGGQADSIDWSKVTNKPADLVQDASYNHTDNNYTADEKTKLAGLSNYDDTALANRVTANETAIADRYTKTETDGKIAEAMTDVDNEHFHPVTALPDPADEDQTKRPKENHEYILIEYEQDGTTIKSETHYLFYSGAYHQKSTGGVSLDGYATEQYVDDGLATKQDVLTTGQGARIRNNVIDTPLLDEIPAIGNRSSFYDQHFYESTKNITLEYLAQYKSAEDRATVYDADLSNYYWRIKYENNTEEFIELRNRRITQAGTTDVVRYDAFKIFTDDPYKHMYDDITWIDINPNGDRIFVFGTYTKNVTEEQMGHPRAMSMTPYAKTMIKKMSDIVKTDLFLQGIIEEKGSGWGVAKSGRLRFVFATQQQEITDLWVDISELGLSSAEDYVVQLTITGGGTMDWGASELFIWEKRTTQFGVTCRNMTSATKDYTIVDYTVIAKGFGGGSGGSGGGGTVDQTYNATSTNAQSGTAVAEALATVDGSTNFDVTSIPQGPTGANEINAVVSNKDTENARLSYIRQADGTLPSTVNLGVKSGLGEDSFELPTKGYVDSKTLIPIFITDGNWSYKINPDNTFEAYYSKSGVLLTIQDTSGNFYRSALQTLTLPTGITDTYSATPLHASVNASHNNYPCFGTLASVATNQIKYYALSGGSRTGSPNYIVTAHVFGTLAAKA